MAEQFRVRDPEFERRIRASFAHQGFMALIGAEIVSVHPGACHVRLPWRDTLSQQHGFFHGGVIGTIADVAGGYAAFSLMAAADSILTVEYKLNLMAPGRGQALNARGQVVRAGLTLTVSRADVFAERDGEEVLIASMQQTLMRLSDRAGLPAGR